jgi:phosphohistidine phosphatase SixA
MNKVKSGKSLELLLALGLTTTMSVTSLNSVNAKETVKTNIQELTTSNTHIFAQAADGGEGDEMSPGEQANADFKDKISGMPLLKALQEGGHIIYFRHAQTEKDYADQVTANPLDCSTQRMLSETGWNQAKLIGESFRKYSIPVGEVISSQYCRAWQTADLAFGKFQKNADLNFPKSEDYTPAQIAQMKAQLMPLLTAVPQKGTNTVIVGHDDVFEAATGIYPAPQGLAYVLTPDGKGGFELIANLTPEEWAAIGGK